MRLNLGRFRLVMVAAALTILILVATTRDASASKYSVAQCGWDIGQDADWSDTAGSGKFTHNSSCASAPSGDPWNGVQMRSLTVSSGNQVSGTKLARWRWVAPSGTGITNVRGTWWHSLSDEFEHRLGGARGSGDFTVMERAEDSHPGFESFAMGFGTAQDTFESRLLCAKPDSRTCDLSPGSYAGIRALNITLEENSAPTASVAGGLLDPGWRSGTLPVTFSASDQGSGIRFSETFIDSARVASTEHTCGKTMIGGEWKGTRLRPCELTRSGSQSINTAAISDGPHQLRHCTTDFAGNVGCTAFRPLHTDNTAPAAPKSLGLAGGDVWSRVNSFTAGWTNPDQGVAAPIAGAYYRITGPGGFDSGALYRGASGVAGLEGLTVPGLGTYMLSVWLRDEAGNVAPGSESRVPLRFDDLAPGVAFRAPEAGDPETIRAEVSDAHSGPAGGAIQYRRVGETEWTDLPTELKGTGAGEADLVAHFPSDQVTPSIYQFRAVALDGAGNSAESSKRIDGLPMTLRAPLKSETRLLAHLESGRRAGARVLAKFGSPVQVKGQLSDVGGDGLVGATLSVVITPAKGTRHPARVRTVATGEGGRFQLGLNRTTSSRIEVRYAGSISEAAARSTQLSLRVRSLVALRASKRKLHTGEIVRLTGSVGRHEARIPAGGKLVAIQYLEKASARWRPVLFVRTNARGSFLARYRFRYITGVAHVQMRAVALAQARWPYATGISRKVRLLVSGGE